MSDSQTTRIENVCRNIGKKLSRSRGGMNVDEMRDVLKSRGLNTDGERDELETRLCGREAPEDAPKRVKTVSASHPESDYFIPETDLSVSNQKYCRCIAHVAGKQEPWCLGEKAWFAERNGKKCYNPYPVCRSRVKGVTGRPACYANYNLSALPEAERRAIQLMEGKEGT